MTQTPDPGAEQNEPAEGIGEEFAGLTPEEFLARTADNTAAEPAAGDAAAEAAEEPADPLTAARAELAERTEDLKRLQAEYVNYRKRVERDRDVARNQGVESIVRDLMPVLDAIVQAEAHGELTGGFKLVADELARVTTRHGLVAFGEPGEEFDPRRHEALMQMPVPGNDEMSIHEVMQKGFELGGTIVRPARVVVAVPTGEDGEQPGDGEAGQPAADEVSATGDEPAGD
ncbi:nucleotide exchange factor GrpE [Propionibacterium australiense]|uniref:Protein GrpE n=1 Tax=Propionibacterium australiense TaxID=119981 RepID=A0A383SA95_9ACTN|nr:nucleotide exchange factor GrpE [Propionibacterium australiense]RLP07180.1 nucleotide exchange factor GrpE [Propionibacterium australiense]RLP07532.1 nucleotide exchange factor GrpE [Propionibacterium australiense]SYZ34156.1 Protein GrpE [grpE] [Propionibacterium australiense]VEH92563.1 HSP-70 cofactor [Propionibacterium australiense]